MYEFTKTDIDGLTLIKPFSVRDERGYMIKPFEKRQFLDNGIDLTCYEAMESCSVRGVLRGLHLQRLHPQAKLVRVIYGEVYDVGVDLRIGSPTFGQWQGFHLSSDNMHCLYLARGLAHGFLVLSDKAVFSYICDEAYYPQDEQGIMWNDADIGIKWPMIGITEPILSDKDKCNHSFKEIYGANL